MIDIKINAKKRRPLKSNYYIGVRTDNKSQSIRFILPRYVDNIDLKDFVPVLNIKLNDFEDVAKLSSYLDGQYIKTEYVLEGTIMQLNGTAACKLKFVSDDVCIWNTELIFLNISNTIDTEANIEQIYPTILSQHTAKITSLENSCNKNSADINELNDDLENLLSNNSLIADEVDRINLDLAHMEGNNEELRSAVIELQLEVTGISQLQQENLGAIGG